MRDHDHACYLQRLRLNATIEPERRLRFFVQVQDGQTPTSSRRRVPVGFANTLDLRQAYVELGAEDGGSAMLGGRQVLTYRDERLVGARRVW